MTSKISQELVDKIVSMYKPNYRYLKSAEMDFPIAKGRFQLGETEYMETLQHMTDVESQLCLNQLCYVFFAQGVLEKRWEGLESLTFDKYLDLRKEGMLITESHKIFHHETISSEPFDGQIQLTKIKRRNNIYLAKLKFDLNEGASVGNLSLVLRV